MSGWMKFRFGWGLFELFALVPLIVFGPIFNVNVPNEQLLAWGHLTLIMTGMVTGLGAILYQLAPTSGNVRTTPLGLGGGVIVGMSIVLTGLSLYIRMYQRDGDWGEVLTIAILLGFVLGTSIGIALCYVWQGIKSLFKHLS